MPTYEYVCRACGHEFEQFQPITSSPVKTCPKCKRKRVERKIGIGAGVLFKGGGFYETDYRSDSYRKSEEAEKKESEKKPEPEKAEATKTPEKTAEKTAEKPTERPEDKPAAKETTSDTPKETPKKSAATPQDKQPKRSAREGRGFGNLKQSTQMKAIQVKSKTMKAKKKTK